MDNERQKEQLPTAARVCGGVIAALLVSLAFVVLYFPPTNLLVEYDSDGEMARKVSEDISTNTPFFVLLISGAILGAFVINGLKVSKIAAGNFGAETRGAEEAAENFYKAPQEERTQDTVKADNDESPEASEQPVSYIDHDGSRYAVYSLDAVPARVIRDALVNWPSDSSIPDNLSLFEFATRKMGKGNHPWTIKFKGKKAVTVSYGGYGKSGATVEHRDTDDPTGN